MLSHAIHMHCDDKNQIHLNGLTMIDPHHLYGVTHLSNFLIIIIIKVFLTHLSSLLPFSMSSNEAFHMKATQLCISHATLHYWPEFERKL